MERDSCHYTAEGGMQLQGGEEGGDRRRGEEGRTRGKERRGEK